MVGGNERKDRAFATCAGAHNEYILELKSTNKLIDEYQNEALPWVLDVSKIGRLTKQNRSERTQFPYIADYNIVSFHCGFKADGPRTYDLGWKLRCKPSM